MSSLSTRAAIPVVLVVLGASPIPAQQVPRCPIGPQGRLQTVAPGGVSSGPILIETSAPILNLFARAEEGIAREDWKFAIDSLQRIIDDPEGALVARSDGGSEVSGLFESARRLATRRIASLPPEGLEAYRILYDGRAKGLFERARAEHDRAGLRTVVDRYLLTQYGDDAADLLASWRLDEGLPAEAMAVLMDLGELVPDPDVPAVSTTGKLAAAYAMLGQFDQVQATMEHGLAGQLHWADELQGLGLQRDEGSWWPKAYGVMPPCEPSLAAATLEHRLPGAAAEWWRWIHDDDPGAPLVLPAGRLASDGHAIYVRTPGGCAALDRDDLTLVWESTSPRVMQTVRPARAAAQPSAGAARSAAEGAVEDYVAESITAAHGLVLLVERGSAPLRPLNPFGFPARQTYPRDAELSTRLTAYDATSGKLRWHSGTIDDPDAALSGAVFRWAPIAVGAELWVPYFRQADFHVAVLHPASGAVIKVIALGSVNQPVDAFGPPTPPTYADGIVFIPSGFGTLFAVDAHDRTVRWARQYDRALRIRTPAVFASTGWLPAEPLVAGGMVILPPVDHSELIALWVASGRTRWAMSVDGGAYLLGADADHLWIGGRGIHCISLATGEVLWQTHLIAPPTGRAAVCGDRIFVPTASGLLSLDAASGTSAMVAAQEALDTPLGNLLCASTALYSLEPTSVRAFPDVERTYAVAQARFDSQDRASVARLAWAELLREAPDKAWALLEAVPPSAVVQDSVLAGRIGRIGVEALMRMARREAPGSAQALAWLMRAERIATGASDRIRCRMEIAEQQSVAGRHEDAYRALAKLGWSEDADRIILVADSVEAPARTEVGRRLAQVEAQLEAHLRANIQAEATKRVVHASGELQSSRESSAAKSLLRAVAELHAATPAGQRALLGLAAWERGRGAFERAELLLRDCVRRTGDPLLTAAGWVELCALYDRPVMDWNAALGPCLTELEARFGAVSFDGPRDPDGSALADLGTRLARGQRVADWVAQVRSSAPAGLLPGLKFDDPTKTVVLTNESVWTRGSSDPSSNVTTNYGRLVDFGESDIPALRDRLVLLRQDGFVECLSLSAGEVLWETQLRGSGDLVAPTVLNPNQTEAPRRAVADGQVAVFNHFDGLYAVGLVTGRRLWVRSLETPEEPSRAYFRDTAMAVDDGLLAAMPRDGRLTLMRLTDGSTVWERDLRGEPVDHVWMHDDRILTLNGAAERLHILNRADGGLIKQVFFRQPDRTGTTVQLVRTAGLIIGPDAAESNAVFAVDVRTGEEAWRIDLDSPVIQLFEPQQGFLGISLGPGLAQVVDVATGETVLERQVPAGRSVVGGALVDGTLVLRADGVRQQKQVVELFAFDVATGEPVWHRDDVDGLAAADKGIPLEHGLIPALTEVMRADISGTGAATPRNRATLRLINAQTGQDAGAPVDLMPPAQGTRFVGDVLVREGVVVVATSRGLQAFRTKVEPRPEVGGNF